MAVLIAVIVRETITVKSRSYHVTAKRVKYRRPQDGRGNKGNAHRGTQLAFGSFGIKTLEAKWIDSRQIEAARVAVNRCMNRQGQVWIRIFLINLLLVSQRTYVWVKVRVILQDGLRQ